MTGKDPINELIVYDIHISSEGLIFKTFLGKTDGRELGTFVGTMANCFISEDTVNLMTKLKESMEKDVYQHIFSVLPETSEEKSPVEKTRLEKAIDGEDVFDLGM